MQNDIYDFIFAVLPWIVLGVIIAVVMVKNSKKKKNRVLRTIMLGIFVAGFLLIKIFSCFGGFGTGESADPNEFAKYASGVENIEIPDGVKIVALGEATHGNVEFQKLKLDVFKGLLENEGIRAFALDGDFGGCEMVNRYIHGGEGTVEEAVADIGFSLYRTKEMEALISYILLSVSKNDNCVIYPLQ